MWGCEGVGTRGCRGRYESVGADQVSKGSSSVNRLHVNLLKELC